MKEQTTRERIFESAEGLMLEKSFHSVGLKQILEAVKVPKGSFYYYFASKEQFGVEMLKHYIKDASRKKRAMLLAEDEQSDPLKRLFTYLDGSIAFVESVAGTFPCLALKLASEVSDLSEGMRSELARGFEDWIRIFQQVLDEAVAAKKLPETVDTATQAQLIQDLWSGAVQRAVINRNAEPVRHAVEHIQTELRAMMNP